MSYKIRILFAAFTLVAVLAWADVARSQSQPYPNRPIHIIVPFTPGSSTDNVARALAPQLGERLGVGIVIDNPSGGGGMVGLLAAARAKPDGYTLLFTESGGLVVLPHLRSDLPYDVETSYLPIGKVGNIDLIFATNPDRPFKSLKELIDLAKAKPGSLSYSSGGTGTAPHIAGELFLQQAGIKVLHVPYKGGGPATTAALAGEVDYVSSAATSIMPLVNSGKLRALAIAAPKRRDFAPDVPTAIESGMPDLIASGWFGLFAPVGTPLLVVEKLKTELAAVAATDEFRKRAAPSGLVPDVVVGDQFKSYIAAEKLKWGNVIRQGGIKLEESK